MRLPVGRRNLQDPFDLFCCIAAIIAKSDTEGDTGNTEKE